MGSRWEGPASARSGMASSRLDLWAAIGEYDIIAARPAAGAEASVEGNLSPGPSAPRRRQVASKLMRPALTVEHGETQEWHKNSCNKTTAYTSDDSRTRRHPHSSLLSTCSISNTTYSWYSLSMSVAYSPSAAASSSPPLDDAPCFLLRLRSCSGTRNVPSVDRSLSSCFGSGCEGDESPQVSVSQWEVQLRDGRRLGRGACWGSAARAEEAETHLDDGAKVSCGESIPQDALNAVSYTHLTLPTIYSV